MWLRHSEKGELAAYNGCSKSVCRMSPRKNPLYKYVDRNTKKKTKQNEHKVWKLELMLFVHKQNKQQIPECKYLEIFSNVYQRAE